MDEGRDTPCLCGAEDGEAGIASYPDDRIGSETAEDASHLYEAFDQLNRQADVPDQRSAVKAGDGNALDAITCLRDLFHFHLADGAYEKQFDVRLLLLQGACDGDGGEDMSAGAAACYDDTFAHAATSPLPAALPSDVSALRATLRMLPKPRPVQRHLPAPVPDL